MIRWSMPILLGVLAGAPAATAACRWFGTQLECDVAGSRVSIGTQAAAEPASRSSLPMTWFDGQPALPERRAPSRLPFDVEIQDFGTDASVCRRIGNEIYCY